MEFIYCSVIFLSWTYFCIWYKGLVYLILFRRPKFSNIDYLHLIFAVDILQYIFFYFYLIYFQNLYSMANLVIFLMLSVLIYFFELVFLIKLYFKTQYLSFCWMNLQMVFLLIYLLKINNVLEYLEYSLIYWFWLLELVWRF